MRPKPDRPSAAVPVTAVFFSIFLGTALLLHAAWIPLKAELAQYLLQRSWQNHLQGDPDSKPWPWADTRSIAVLSVPRLGIRQLVLEGSSGRNLAFGPTLSEGSLVLNDWIINGHRDTHFRFLQQLQQDDLLEVRTAERLYQFKIETLEVIDSDQYELVLENGLRRLSLVTCFPFDAIAPGGPLRYVVTALPLSKKAQSKPVSLRSVSSG